MDEGFRREEGFSQGRVQVFAGEILGFRREDWISQGGLAFYLWRMGDEMGDKKQCGKSWELGEQ